jgi:hypothetical protein
MPVVEAKCAQPDKLRRHAVLPGALNSSPAAILAGSTGRLAVCFRGMVGCDGHPAERREPAPPGHIGDGRIALFPGAGVRTWRCVRHGPHLEPRGYSGGQACCHTPKVGGSCCGHVSPQSPRRYIWHPGLWRPVIGGFSLEGQHIRDPGGMTWPRNSTRRPWTTPAAS